MSAGVVDVEAASSPPAPPVRPSRRVRIDHAAITAPIVAAVLSAAAFLAFTPNVGDLQAALARAAAARSGVGLGYWFQWFGGGSTPGNYSVVTPWLSSLLGAALVGALATVAITPLAAFAARATAHPVAATWTATVVAGFSLWSGRVPFALGSAVALGALVALRARRYPVVWALTVLSCFCSPVTGAFLAFVLGAAFLVEPAHRRGLWPVVAVAGGTLVAIAVFFGSPGPQPYAIGTALMASGSALVMLLARPAPSVRITLWLTAIAAPLFSVISSGMGSNWNRMPWIWLPAAVVATAVSRRWLVTLAVLPAVIMSTVLTVSDVVHSRNPAASASYYDSLIGQLGQRKDLDNYRVEVVQDTAIHTAAYALIGHAALAGGYETQEQAELNAILADPALDADSYKLWLDNNAVGYVAFNRRGPADEPEYNLVAKGGLPYLSEVSSDAKWTLYRVDHATPIIAGPATLLRARQDALTIHVSCACSFPIRVRYSDFLELRTLGGGFQGSVRDDGTGWTVLRTPIKGTYTLSGSVTHPFAPR